MTQSARNPTPTPVLPDVARVLAAVEAERDVDAAWLFGSAATGKMRADSDIDIALRFGPALDASGRLASVSRLTAELGLAGRGRVVQVIDLLAVDHRLRFAVFRDGRLLFDRDPPATANLLERTLNERWDWLPVRAIERHARDLRDRAAEARTHGG